MKKSVLTAVYLFFLVAIPAFSQAPLPWDTTFKYPPFLYNKIDQLKTLANKDILVTGSFQTSATNYVWGMALLDSNGALKTTVDEGPTQGYSGSTVQAGGKIVFTRFNQSASISDVKRFNADLSADPSFGFVKFVPAFTWAPLRVASLADGSLLVAGSFSACNGNPHYNIVKLKPNGDVDPAFNLDNGAFPIANMANAWICNAWPLPDGKIMIALEDYTTGAVNKGIYRLMANGSIDPAFNPGLQFDPNFPAVYIGEFSGGVVQPDGSFIISNYALTGATGVTSKYIVRIKPDGTPDTSFHYTNPSGGFAFREIALQEDGRLIVAGGYSTNFQGVHRIHPNGSFDSTLAVLSPYLSSDPNGHLLDFQTKNSLLVAYSDTNNGRRFQLFRYRLNNSPPAPRKNTIEGKIFTNLNNNCVKDGLEKPLNYHVVKAEPGAYWGYTDTTGKYTINTDTGEYVVKQVLPSSQQGLLETQYCPGINLGRVVDFGPVLDSVSTGNDFANTVVACPFMTVSIASVRRRACFRNQTTVYVCNSGYAPAPANSVVKVRFPRFVHMLSASEAYTFNPTDSTYNFQLGAMPQNTCKTIYITDSVSCINWSVLLGQAQCTKAIITPGNICLPNSANWDGVDLAVTASCVNDKPRFKIENTGVAMTATRLYNIYVGAALAYTNAFQLGAGSSMSVTVPQATPDQTVRMEVAQSPNHPTSTFVAADISCGTGTVNIGGGFFPMPDESPVVSINCLNITYGYDPNDKEVWPKGATAQGNVLPNRKFDYRIRFQNTGNDTTYNVVVVDTLDAGFNLATLEMGVVSHPYQLNISGKGRPVLTWKFDNIYLPDSIVDEPGSHGFIDFSIRPYDTLELGTQLRNFADIYFDFNPAVRTNTTLNTLYAPTLTTGLIDSVEIFTPVVHTLSQADIRIFPNPGKGKFRVEGKSDFSVKVFSLAGKQLQFDASRANHIVDLERFGTGIYFVEMENPEGKITKKVVVE